MRAFSGGSPDDQIRKVRIPAQGYFSMQNLIVWPLDLTCGFFCRTHQLS